MEIEIIDGSFSVCKVVDFSGVDLSGKYTFTGVSDEENSLICRTENVPANVTERIDGWRAMRIKGILDFSLIGILSGILTVLADAKIGIAAVSTYNTDYIFVREKGLGKAADALAGAGYKITHERRI